MLVLTADAGASRLSLAGRGRRAGCLAMCFELANIAFDFVFILLQTHRAYGMYHTALSYFPLY